MSDPKLEVVGLDVDEAVSEGIRRRALAELARQADPETRSFVGRAEAFWVRRAEPLVVGVFAVAFVIWALGVSFAA